MKIYECTECGDFLTFIAFRGAYLHCVCRNVRLEHYMGDSIFVVLPSDYYD